VVWRSSAAEFAQPPRVYNERKVLENQIIRGDCVKVLEAEPEGWVDLCFADPPFNIGNLDHGYDDQKDVDE
jgi:site-specific DNA-methyltransferase (adenine-specific)